MRRGDVDVTCRAWRRTALVACALVPGLILASSSFASFPRWATITWDGGGGDSNWSTAANWVGDVVPATADTAVFDGTSSKACTINDSVSILGLQIQGLYTGTVSREPGVTVTVGTSGYTQSGGTFTGGSGVGGVTLNGPFSMTGGTFNAPTAGIDLNVSGNFSVTGGTFSAGTGSVVLNGTGAQSLSASGVAFSGLTIGAAHTVTASTSVNVDGTLTVTGTLDVSNAAATLTTAGTVTIVAGGAVTRGTAGWTFDGTSSAILTANGISIGDITIDGTAKLVSLGSAVTIGTLTIAADDAFHVKGNTTSITTLSNLGTFRLYGSESGAITITNGNDIDSGTWEYVGNGDATQNLWTIKDFGTTDYYNLTLTDAVALERYAMAADLKVVQTLTLSGLGSGCYIELNGWTLDIATLSNDGTVRLRGTETTTITNGNDVNSGRWLYEGDGDATSQLRTIKDWGTTDYFTLQIFASGTLPDTFQLAGALTVNERLWLSLATDLLHFNGQSVTVVSPGFVDNSGTIRLFGSETVTLPANGNDSNSGTWEFVGNGGTAETFNIPDFGTTDYFNIRINDTAATPDTFSVSSSITSGGTVQVSAGTLSVGTSRTLTSTGLTVDGGTMTINLCTVDVNGNLSFSAGTLQFTTSGTMNVSGNWVRSGGAFVPNSGTVTLDGVSNQTLTSTGASFYVLTINNSAASVIPTDTVTATGGTNCNGGTLNLAVNNVGMTTFNLILNGGSFTGGTSNVTVQNAFQINGAGSCTAPSGTLFVAGGFQRTGAGAFTHNGGTVNLNGSGAQTLNCASPFNILVIGNSGPGVTLGIACTVASGGSLAIQTGRLFSLSGFGLTASGATFSNDGTLRRQGGESVSLTQDTDSGTWEFTGNGDGTADTFTSLERGAVDYYNLTINDTSAIKDSFSFSTGSVVVVNQVSVSGGALTHTTGTLQANGFTVSGGTYAGGSGPVDINGGVSISSGAFTSTSGLLKALSFSHTGGTFAHNSGRVLLNNTTNQLLSVTSTTTLNDLYVNGELWGYWNLDETSGTVAGDSSGYGRTGTRTNGPTTSTSTAAPLQFTNLASLSFDGTNDYVTMGDVLDMGTPQSFTLSAWVNHNTVTPGQTEVITAKSTGTVGYSFGLMTADFLTCTLGDGVNTVTATAGTAMTLGTWHHVAAVVDRGNQLLKLYLDGVAVGSAGTVLVTDMNNAQPFRIGIPSIYSGTASTDNAWDGFIDDVRVYARPLTLTEISLLAAGNQPQTSVATTTISGAALVVSNRLALCSGTLDVSATNFGVTVAGDWRNEGGLFVPRAGTVTMTGGASHLYPGSQAFNNLTLNLPSNGVACTLNGATTVSGSLTVTTGILSQIQWNLSAGPVTIGLNGTWQNLSTGDITLTGDVGTSGVISFNGGGPACQAGGDAIVITSGTVRTWTGTGQFTIVDVDITNQARSGALVTIYSSTSVGGGNSGWTFDAG